MHVLLYIENEKVDNCLSEYFDILGAFTTPFCCSILVLLCTRRNLVATVYRKTIANNIRDCCYVKTEGGTLGLDWNITESRK